MEALYKDLKRSYKRQIESLLYKNIQLVNSATNTKDCYINFTPNVDKSVIPFIQSSPKTHFVNFTNISLFTKDDPILRYVPVVREVQLSTITWFESMSFGSKPFDVNDMADLLLIRNCQKGNMQQEGFEFIKRNFKREPISFFKPLQLDSLNGGSNSASECSNLLDENFCSICMLFGCGFHTASKSSNPSLLSKCHCKTNEKDGLRYIDSIRLFGFNSNRKHDYQIPLTDFNQIKNIFHSKKCIFSLFFNNFNYFENFAKKLISKKKVKLAKNEYPSNQFFQPCSTNTSQTCSCVKNNTYCEYFCGCTSCSNAIFCKCKSCGTNCACKAVNRECSALCGCDGKKCENTPISSKLWKKVSICKSYMHGLGLFAEEFIPAGSFVIEYTGEIITDIEAERRGNFYEYNKVSYLFNCMFSESNCLFSLDAFFLGNKSRFINHSVSKANLKSDVILSHGKSKIVFYSLRDIYKGEEMLFDYQFSEEHKKKHGILD